MNRSKPSKHVLIWIVSLFCIATISSCSKDDDVVTPEVNADQLYAQSIMDAIWADSSEVIDTLWPIANTNAKLKWKTINGQSYVLMATFMRFPGSYPEGDSITNTWGDSWLFAPTQMKERIGSSFTASSDTIMRVCQLLGLPPVNARSNTHIAEVWVKPERLMRPAGNPSITTTTSSAVLSGGVSPEYSSWFNDYIIYAYYRPLQPANDYHYPWTRLGYTYDWAPGSKKVGLSEYVLQASSGIWVEKVRTASAYFKD
ncbi:hypothetical protein [Chitinophaga tropicalis]|nr:hypothetical protein [Chitinophaga tropicalis]